MVSGKRRISILYKISSASLQGRWAGDPECIGFLQTGYFRSASGIGVALPHQEFSRTGWAELVSSSPAFRSTPRPVTQNSIYVIFSTRENICPKLLTKAIDSTRSGAEGMGDEEKGLRLSVRNTVWPFRGLGRICDCVTDI